MGGFSVREIARAFLADDAAIAQRLVRAKRQIREGRLTLEVPRGPELQRRLELALSPSSVVALNRDPVLQDYYLLAAVRGHLLLELGRTEEAGACYRAALERRCSEPERRFLRRKLAACDSLRPEAGRGIYP